MKRIPMLAMMIAPYFLLWVYVSQNFDLLPVSFGLFGAVMFFGAIYAFFLPGRGFSGEQILFWGMLLKICNIPIFAAIFITSVLLFVMIIPLLPFLFLFDIFLLFTTSMYGISGILQCGRENSLPPKARGVNLILQWIFCADLFSTIYCYLKAKNQR